jgi:hypothetical protein
MLCAYRGPRPQQARALTLPLLSLLGEFGLSLEIAEIILDAVAVFVYLLLAGRLLTLVRPDRSRFWVLFAVVPLIATYAVFGYVSYPSDLPALALFTLGAYALVREATPLFWIVCVFAALNRETGALLVALYVLYRWPRREYEKTIVTAIGLALLFAGVFLALQYIFGSNPGTSHEDHLTYNLSLARQAFTLHRPGLVYWTLTFGGFHIVSLFALRRSPYIFRVLFICSIILVIAMLPVGLFTETRIFNEAIPGFTFPAIVLLSDWLSRSRSNHPHHSTLTP